MKIERYPAYKDSGLEWLGGVPEHWEIMMIKNVYQCFGSGTTPDSSETKYYENGTINWLNTTDLKNSLVSETKRKITQLALTEKSLKIYPINTLAIAMYGQGDTRGNVGLLNIESTTNQAACMMYRSFNSIPKYMLWWFIAKKSDIRKINVGATQPNMNQDFLKNLFISLPPLSEQKAIADYLDTKTSQIDRKIDLLTQKVALYGDLKQSLINETVTRGLDKSVPMKDSGIELIGKVPEHWVVKRVKELLISGNLGMKIGPFGSSIKLEIIRNTGYKIYGQEHVINDNFKIGHKYVDELKFKELQKYQILPGDIVVTMMGTVGKSKVVPEKIEKGIMDSHLIRIRVLSSLVIPALLALSINEARYIKDQRKVLTKGSIMEGVNSQIIKSLNIVIPPLSEQKAIADYLDTKTAQIDQIIQTINTQIEKLKELRKTLINDVVTGKIKVV